VEGKAREEAEPRGIGINKLGLALRLYAEVSWCLSTGRANFGLTYALPRAVGEKVKKLNDGYLSA